MKHFTSPSFWDCYSKLPFDIKHIADKNFNLMKTNPKHPSLNLKKIERFWSARIGIKYRALGIEDNDSIIWFWIGNHDDYDNLLRK